MKNFIKVTGLIILTVLLPNKSGAQSISPIKDANGKYGFTFGNFYFEVNPALGGRITSLKMDTVQILFLDNLDEPNGSDNAGSTFWPSPQSVWNWPPLLALNFNAYQVLSSDSNLSIRSSTDATTNLYFEKIFTVNSADTSISINYIMKNTNKLAESWAPWEITRVKASGLTFFAIGSGSVTGNMASNTKVLNNSGWYNQDSTTVPTNGTYKFFCDGKGWIAHKTDSRYLFIKKFPDISKTSPAPGEAEVECYTASDHSYTEIEDQGAYTSIPGGDSISWQVKWYIRKLPEDIIGVSGEQKLLDFVNKTINPNTTSIVKEQVIGDLFEVYPNPAIQKLTIINNVEPFKNAVVSIYDLQGQLIFKVNLMKSQSDIDLSKLNNGPYLLEISGDNNQKLFSRIIVKS